MGCPNPVRLADFQTGRLDEPGRKKVEAHLASCAACRAAAVKVALARQALREIADDTAQVPAALSSARIEATLRWTRSQPSIPAFRGGLLATLLGERPAFRLGWSFAAAAAVAGVVVLAAHRRGPVKGPETVARVVEHVAPAVAPAPKPSVLEAIVTLIGGDAKLGRDSATEALSPLTRLGVADRLETAANGRVAFQWAEGSGALLGGGSELALSRLETKAQDLALGRGQIAVRVGPHQPGESLRVLTPDHTITVHGTWFVVSVDVRGTSVQVLEGVVEVAAREGDDSSTRVAAPQRAWFARGKGTADGSRPLSGREAAALRLATEMGMLPSWTSIESALGATGMLDIQSAPAASLVVDGVAFGQTPLDLRRVRGRHLVELSRPGFATISRWVAVGAEPGELKVALRVVKDASPEIPPEKSELQATYDAHKSRIRACYEHSLKLNPNLGGAVMVRVDIGGMGEVRNSAVKNAALFDDELVKCLRRDVGGWVWAKARNVTFEFPIKLEAH